MHGKGAEGQCTEGIMELGSRIKVLALTGFQHSFFKALAGENSFGSC